MEKPHKSEKLTFILLLGHLATAVSGTTTTVTYYAEEDNNVTLSWDLHAQTDASFSTFACSDVSRGFRVLFQLVEGDEVPESQDPQFKGRVHCDKVALRHAQIKLQLSRLSAGDSGRYTCTLTNFDQTSGRTDVQAPGTSVLIVDKADPGKTPPGLEPPQPGPAGPEDHPAERTSAKMKWSVALALCALVAVLGYCAVTLYGRYYTAQQRARWFQQRDAFIDLLTRIGSTGEPHHDDLAAPCDRSRDRQQTRPGPDCPTGGRGLG